MSSSPWERLFLFSWDQPTAQTIPHLILPRPSHIKFYPDYPTLNFSQTFPCLIFTHPTLNVAHTISH